MAIRKEGLSKLKRNGAAKNHEANATETLRIADKEKKAELSERSYVFDRDDKTRLGLGQLWP